MSREAADAIVEEAISRRTAGGSKTSSVNDATVSRLLAARAAGLLTRTERPRMSRLETVTGAGVVVSDALTHEAVAVFAGEDSRLMPWLSRPYPSVLVPDGAMSPKLLKHAVDFVVAMPSKLVADAVGPLLSRAEARLESLLARATDGCSTLAGNARHFSRMCAGLYDALGSSDAAAGRKAVSSWVDAQKGVWAEVFSPVLRFLDTFAAVIFSHPICVEPPPPTGRHHMSGPASLLTLRLDHDRRRPTLHNKGPALLFAGGNP